MRKADNKGPFDSLWDIIFNMEGDLRRLETLLRAEYELIGEAIDKNDPDGHEVKQCICIVAMETQERVLEQWEKAFKVALDLKDTLKMNGKAAA